MSNYLTIKEAAKMLDCARSNLYYHHYSGNLNMVYMYGRRLIVNNELWQNMLKKKEKQ